MLFTIKIELELKINTVLNLYELFLDIMILSIAVQLII
jgi:hypothetical protein